MDNRKILLSVVIVIVAVFLVFMVNAYKKQVQGESVLKLQIETNKETDSGEIVKETKNIVIYDQDDIERVEEQLRALGYIE